jgi:predicted DNA-binding transcriptional regulator AlpA
MSLKQRQIEQLEQLLTIREVKGILGISYGVIYGLIRDGRLRCWKYTGEPFSRVEVGEKTWGLRFWPSDVREFLNQAIVK